MKVCVCVCKLYKMMPTKHRTDTKTQQTQEELRRDDKLSCEKENKAKTEKR